MFKLFRFNLNQLLLFLPNYLPFTRSHFLSGAVITTKKLVMPFAKQTFTMAIVRARAREQNQAERRTKSTKRERERERFATKGTRAGRPCRMQGGVSNWPVRQCVSACV